MILDSFENRFRDRADIELMISAQPAIVSNHSPTDSFCQKQRTNLIIRWRIDCAKQIAALKSKFDSMRIEFVGDRDTDRRFNTREHVRADG
jgi:hypothetical protein